MKIILVGTGTGVPSRERNAPCIAVKTPNKAFILDGGPGSLKRLLSTGIDCLNLDAAFYTHFHFDHIAGLAEILFAAKIPPSVRKKDLLIYGPSGLEEYYNRLKGLHDYTICTDAYKLSIEEITDKSISIDGHCVLNKKLLHHDGGSGYRVTAPDGKAFVYTGDTDYCEEAVELARDAELLAVECSFPDELKMKGHLTPESAGILARKAGVKKIVLVHMYPICEQYDLVSPCKKEFQGEILVGRDMLDFEI